jgi:YidC/Oxa1 family membrane protein insertase
MEKRNLIIALAASMIIMLVWMNFFAPKPSETSKQVENQVTESVEENSISESEVTTATAVNSQNIFKDQSLVEEDINVVTDNYKVVLSTKGALIKSIKYGKRELELAVSSEGEPELFDFGFYLSEKSFLGEDPLKETLWYVTEKSDKRIVFARNLTIDSRDLTVHKIYDFDTDGYYFNLSYVFTNSGKDSVVLPEGKIIFATPSFVGPVSGKKGGRFNHFKQMYYTSKKEVFSKGGGFFKKDAPDYKTSGAEAKWGGVIGRYFVSLLLADEKNTADNAIADSRKETEFKTGLEYKTKNIAPEKSQEYSFKAVISEKRKDYLKAIDPTLEGASDTNKWIDPIRMFVIWCLKKLNTYIPNFGWCIVIFSIVSKLVFLPLTHKSAQSMKKMSSLQPEIQKLKEKYKNDPQKAQQAQMAFMKEKGVNPMGGCLPLLVQMPFFLALYSALSNSLDMYNTPFILWIHDLSVPETAFTVFGFDMRILPLIMTVTSFLQQKMTTVDTSVGGQQQMMMKMMPIFLLFIFWSFPAGLIIYWTIQNTMQVLHQLIVNSMQKKTA